jgi:hypothetical protein
VNDWHDLCIEMPFVDTVATRDGHVVPYLKWIQAMKQASAANRVIASILESPWEWRLGEVPLSLTEIVGS